MRQSHSRPETVTIDPTPEELSLFVHPDAGLFVPAGMVTSFDTANRACSPLKLETFERMLGSSAVLESGLPIALTDPDSAPNARQLVIHTSPLDRCLPTSDAPTIYRFCSQTTEVNLKEAGPHSHRGLANFDTIDQVSRAEGLGEIAHLQLFTPEWKAMSFLQRMRVARGDAHPYGELALQALEFAEQRYGRSFDSVHFFGAGLGLKALGAADYFTSHNIREVRSVTLMNFAVDPNPLRALYNYMAKSTSGSPSEQQLPSDHVRINEFSIALVLDKAGAETAMRTRNIQALRHILMLSSLISARRAPEYISNLLDAGASMTVANAINESLVQRSLNRIGPATEHPRFHTIDIAGVKETKTGMQTNEFFALTALLVHLGLKNHRQDLH